MASAWSSLSLSRRLSWASLLCVGLIALAFGTFARFYDLGGAPLAEDEYYTTRSIEWVLANGVPAMPGGGYYDRALLFQYAAAGFAELVGPDAFAYRLPAALCGLIAGVLGFFYARRFGGVAIGLAVAAALLLSSWEIEFARLVRFYTLFQVTLLLFLIALDEAYFEARAGWRYLPHAALLAAALAHELAILLTPLLFLPLLPQMTNLRLGQPRHWLGFALVSLIVTLVVVLFTLSSPFGGSVPTDRLPEDYDWPAGGMGGRFATPILPFFRLFPEPIVHLAAVGILAAALVIAFIVARRLGARRVELARPAARARAVGRPVPPVRGDGAPARAGLRPLRLMAFDRPANPTADPARRHPGGRARLAGGGRSSARAPAHRRGRRALGYGRNPTGRTWRHVARGLEHLLRLA